MTVLSKEAILEEIEKGNIVFDGKKSQIQNQSIDVSLGSEILVDVEDEYTQSNCYSTSRFLTVSLLSDKENSFVRLKKGTFFLAYTNEFVGTRIGSNIHCQFQQTSTSARLGLMHGKAGWGDVGFISRWAMEFYVAKDIIIKAGDIVGQMSFMYTTPTKESYADKGQYQKGNNLEELKANWNINSILPKNSLKNIKDLV